MADEKFFDTLAPYERKYVMDILDAGMEYMGTNTNKANTHPMISELFRIHTDFFNKLLYEMLEHELKSE